METPSARELAQTESVDPGEQVLTEDQLAYFAAEASAVNYMIDGISMAFLNGESPMKWVSDLSIFSFHLGMKFAGTAQEGE